jgi:phage baseplate assembly protein V
MIEDVSRLLASPAPSDRLDGVAIAVVTNNKDPDGLGRVKVKLPWIAEGAESDWARVVTPMAGRGRGIWFLPEVDDEVLVAFEHGNPGTPYVLGALWNGKDKPPEANSDGKNDVRVIRSRSGHVIRLTDTDNGQKIEIVDAGGKNSVVIDTRTNTVSVTGDTDVVVQATNGKLTLRGRDVEITAKAAVKVDAGAGMDLKAGTQLNVKGQVVNIN